MLSFGRVIIGGGANKLDGAHTDMIYCQMIACPCLPSVGRIGSEQRESRAGWVGEDEDGLGKGRGESKFRVPLCRQRKRVTNTENVYDFSIF